MQRREVKLFSQSNHGARGTAKSLPKTLDLKSIIFEHRIGVSKAKSPTLNTHEVFFILGTKFSRNTTGSPSSKYEHRRTSALLRNIQNIRICMGKKTYRFCAVTFEENERISITKLKKKTAYLT